MAWEDRGGRRVYYRSVRLNGTPRKVYLGGGQVAEAEAERVESAQRRRQAERDTVRAECARDSGADAALREFRETANVLLQASLLLSGFHLDHGEWRRRRGRTRLNGNPRT
jgi:hypothetical protein